MDYKVLQGPPDQEEPQDRPASGVLLELLEIQENVDQLGVLDLKDLKET